MDMASKGSTGFARPQTDAELFLDEFCRLQLAALVLQHARRNGGARKNVLPTKRVKLIMKQDLRDPNLCVSASAAELMTFAAQAFVASIIAVSYQFTVERKRRTVTLLDLTAAVKASSRFSFLIDVVSLHQNQYARGLPRIAPYSVPTTFVPQPMPVLRQGATDRETHEYAESRAVPLDGVPRQRSLSDTSAWVVELFRRP